MAEQDRIIISKKLKKETLQDINWCVTTLSSLLNDPSTHDVTFKTSDGGSVSGHRAIVAAFSPVFHAMLYGNMKESNEKEITLPSVDTKTLKALLSFAYTGKIEVNTENCFGLLEAAHYFNVAVLEKKCTDFITTLLSTENCCTIANFAYSRMIDILVNRCLAFMYPNAYKIVEDAGFKSLQSDLLLKFCKSSDLHVKEIRLFLAVVQWCLHQTEISDGTIKNVFRQIRYPLISISDLLEKVRPIKHVDSTLYTAALEFHHMPSKYNRLKSQLVKRKLLDFSVINLTTSTVRAIEDGLLVTITKKSRSNDWDAICAVQMCLTEQLPVNFKFILNYVTMDNFGIQILVKSYLESNTSFSNLDSIGISGFIPGEEVFGKITMKGRNIFTTIGHKTVCTTRRHDSIIYLYVYLYHSNNSVSFLQFN